jgi:sugar phosphate isomerase/epimerase
MKRRELLASYFTIAGDVHPIINDVPSPFAFRDRVETAARAGFRGFGLFHTDLPPVVARHGYDGMRAIFADNGMKWIEVECLFNWFAQGESRKASNAQRALLLQASQELGAFHMKVATDISKSCPRDQMIEAYAGLCEDGASIGTKISLEMTPFSNTPDLTSVMAIVKGAGHSNGGLMLDLWHVSRGGVVNAEIAALPKGSIFSVELADATAAMHGDLLEDTLNHRRFCGEGDFDVTGFIAALDVAGFEGPYGVEVLSNELRTLSLAEAVRRAFETTAAAFGVSGFEAIESGTAPHPSRPI